MSYAINPDFQSTFPGVEIRKYSLPPEDIFHLELEEGDQPDATPFRALLRLRSKEIRILAWRAHFNQMGYVLHELLKVVVHQELRVNPGLKA